MTRDLPEADWRVFSKIRETALDLFYQRVVDQLAVICSDKSITALDRYEKVRSAFRSTEAKLVQAFDNPRRSQMHWQLAAMYAEGLVGSDDFARLSQPTRDRVRMLTELVSG